MSAPARASAPAEGASWLAVAALVAASAWWRWEFLTSTPYPLGVDGYYYPVQLRALLEDGALAYPASPLAFWLMAPLAAWLGPIAGAKLGAALGGALVAVPAFGLGRRFGGRGAGLVAAAVATTSAGSFYLGVEFVKQGLGVTVGLTALWLVARALECPAAGRGAAAAAAVIAAALTHKMAAALVVAVALPAVIVEARARGWLRARRVALAAVIVVAVAIGLGVAFPERFLGERDVDLVGRLFTADARWDLPVYAGRRSLYMGHETLLAAIASAAALVVLVRGAGRGADRAMAIAVASFGVVLAVPWLDVADPQGLPFRLRLVAFVPLALGAAVIAGAVARLPRLAALPIALAALVVIVQPRSRDEGVVVTHPAMVAAVRALDGVVPPGGVIIASERHIAFMVAWYTRDPARLRPEVVDPARRWRLMPLAFIGEGTALATALAAARAEPSLVPPRGLHPRHPDGLVVVPEATWTWILARLPAASARYYAAWPTL
jgi:hypothetical protein